MYFGETAINLDAKGRLAIPMRYRDSIQEACGGALVLTYSAFDHGALYLYPQEKWEEVRDKVMTLSTFDQRHRSLQRRSKPMLRRSLSLRQCADYLTNAMV